MSSDTTKDRDDLDVAEETIEDLDVDEADVQGGSDTRPIRLPKKLPTNYTVV